MKQVGNISVNHFKLTSGCRAIFRHELQKMSGTLGLDLFKSLTFTYEECSRRLSGLNAFTTSG